MARFMERELNEKIKYFENLPNVEIKVEGIISAKIVIDKAVIEFDDKTGYINIENEKEKIKINTTLVNKYEEIKNELYIHLGEILLKIKKIC